MAARRLIFVLIVMLLLSSLAAALVPVERERREQSSSSATTTTTTTTRTAPAVPATGRLIEDRLDASAKRPETAAIDLGDQLQLEVEADRPDTVSIPALGEFHDVEPGSPATFDLLPFEAGRYAVRLVDADRLVGWIDVAPPAPGRGEEPGDGRGRSGQGLDQDEHRPDGGEAGADKQARADA